MTESGGLSETKNTEHTWFDTKYKNAVLVMLIASCFFLTIYFHIVLRTCVVFTHLFYIPIMLAGLWWRKKGIIVAVFLGVVLISTHILFVSEETVADDYLRVVMFIVVASVVGTLSKQTMKISYAMRDTCEYLDKLLTYSSTPIIIGDTMLRITRVNTAFEKLTGYTAGEVFGRGADMLFQESSLNESMQKIRQGLTVGNMESVEIPLLCKNGDIRSVLWNSANIFAKDKKTLQATIIQGIDVTDRKKTMEELQKAKETLDARVVDLEMFTKVAVDRELRMVELKREINSLLDRIGESPRYSVPVSEIKRLMDKEKDAGHKNEDGK
jgi:PAS domain S-box-containing protein